MVCWYHAWTPMARQQKPACGPQMRTIRRGENLYRTLDRSKADLIVAVDGLEVKSLDDFLGIVEAKKPGDTVVIRVQRNGKPVDVTVTLADLAQ